METQLLETTVFHKRHFPVEYGFAHKVIFLAFNSKFIPKTHFFSLGKFNLFSLWLKNYKFQENVPTEDIHEVVLLTIPKVLGKGFNPVSFWCCFNQRDELLCVLVEVNNTFGETHGYLCCNESGNIIEKDQILDKPKIFHVSPFCQVRGHYDFRFEFTQKTIHIDINYYQDDKLLISTAIRGKKQPLNDKNLMKYFCLYPFMAFKVIFLIHYHALRLWLKKVPYFSKPIKPDIDIS